ncbi:MAG: iron-containing alcohol dehydrogenase [bacterium]
MNSASDRDGQFAFGTPVRLHYGRGLVDGLAAFCPGAGRVLVVTGRGSAARSGLLERVCVALKGREVEVFGGVEPNPSIETVEHGAAAAIRINADLVIGLGGGSALDAAKCIAALATNGGRFAPLLGRSDYDHGPLRMIAIPTTCGTGSEANRYAIISDLRCNDKVTFESRHTYPAAGILDPSVLDSIPVALLAETGCDAFTHALEGYTSRRCQPFSDAVALEAMNLIISSLPGAVDGVGEAKAALLYAAALAGIVIDHTGTTMLHAMGYFLTMRHGIAHGKANAVFLPVLFTHLEREIPDRLDKVYSMFPPDMRGADGIVRYLDALGIEASPAACGMGRAEAAGFVDYVLARKNTANTAGTVTKDRLLGLIDPLW